MSGWNRKESAEVSKETVWLVALQLRHHYGSARFEVRLGENVVLIRPIAEFGPELIDRVAFCLRSMGWSTFQSEGSIPRIIVAGRGSAINLGRQLRGCRSNHSSRPNPRGPSGFSSQEHRVESRATFIQGGSLSF